MIDLETERRQFAEQLRAAARLTSDTLVDALAHVPRERFLGPGPWLVRGEGDRAARATPDADPRHVYQNVSVALDASRDLYNGQPGLVAAWLDDLGIRPGDRALHIGCGTGYYSALIAELTARANRAHALAVGHRPAG